MNVENAEAGQWEMCLSFVCDGLRYDKCRYYEEVVNCHLDHFAHSPTSQLQQKCNLISNAFPLLFSNTMGFLMALFAKRPFCAAVAFKNICCLLMDWNGFPTHLLLTDELALSQGISPHLLPFYKLEKKKNPSRGLSVCLLMENLVELLPVFS